MANDFLPFGGDGAANVMSQADYVALAARLTGFQSGVAKSAQLNKVWRQSSIIAAVLAQFIVDLSGQDAVDDGTLTTLLTNLKSAVSAQSVGVIGAMRNARMSVTAASATATFTADEIVVENTLGGKTYRLPSFNKTINLATTGAGGMDTGAAPASGYVALYAIYNPTTGASALLGKNATAAVQASVYGGANMPAGYTASALVGVWPTNGSGQFTIGYQRDRRVSIPNVTILSSSTVQASFASLSISGAVPPNAVSAGLTLGALSSTAGTTQTLFIAADANSIGGQAIAGMTSVAGNVNTCNGQVPIITPQTLYWKSSNSGGTPTFSATLCSYDI